MGTTETEHYRGQTDRQGKTDEDLQTAQHRWSLKQVTFTRACPTFAGLGCDISLAFGR